MRFILINRWLLVCRHITLSIVVIEWNGIAYEMASHISVWDFVCVFHPTKCLFIFLTFCSLYHSTVHLLDGKLKLQSSSVAEAIVMKWSFSNRILYIAIWALKSVHSIPLISFHPLKMRTKHHHKHIGHIESLFWCPIRMWIQSQENFRHQTFAHTKRPLTFEPLFAGRIVLCPMFFFKCLDNSIPLV